MKMILLLIIGLIFSTNTYATDQYTLEDFKNFQSGKLQIKTELECNKLYEEAVHGQVMDIILKWDKNQQKCKIKSTLPLAKKYKKYKIGTDN